jgi:hypothetical protein
MSPADILDLVMFNKKNLSDDNGNLNVSLKMYSIIPNQYTSTIIYYRRQEQEKVSREE